MKKALFLDRDGVINVDKGYVSLINEFEFIPEIFEVLAIAQDKNYEIFIVTNQSGIGRGMYTEQDFLELTQYMNEEFEKYQIRITKTYYCAYHPDGMGKYRQDSHLRKPAPGMILQAISEFRINRAESVLIGDQETDIQAAINAGLGKTILFNQSKTSRADHVIGNLNEAIELL